MARFPDVSAPARQPTSLTVFYNGGCPLCRSVVTRYRRLLRVDAEVLWRDVRRYPEALGCFGVGRDEAGRCVHVVDRTGALRTGVDAAIALWREMPGKRRRRAWIMSLPGVHQVAGWLYGRGIVPWAAHGH